MGSTFIESSLFVVIQTLKYTDSTSDNNSRTQRHHLYVKSFMLLLGG